MTSVCSGHRFHHDSLAPGNDLTKSPSPSEPGRVFVRLSTVTGEVRDEHLLSVNDSHGFDSTTEQTKRNELRTTVFLVIPPGITKRLGPDSNNSTLHQRPKKQHCTDSFGRRTDIC